MSETPITPAVRPLDADAVPPGSKSITNRALILAALCGGQTILQNVLEAEDTLLMLSALQKLGLAAEHSVERREITMLGSNGSFPNNDVEIDVGNSGTTARFLAAVLAFSQGNYRLYGKPRMYQRPIGDLVGALKYWEAHIEYENDNGFLPLRIFGRSSQVLQEDSEQQRSELRISGSVSSQFLSGLLLAAPLAARFVTPSSSQPECLKIWRIGKFVSQPYIAMTLETMKSFGMEPEVAADFSTFCFSPNQYYRTPSVYRIEPDASAASYFFAAAAIAGGRVTVQGLSRNSLQGDVAFADALEQMGCTVQWNTDSITVQRSPERPLRGIGIDMNSFSDTVQTLAVTALFADGVTEIRNVEHIRFKETDRIADLATELRRFGAVVEERPDGLKIIPPERLQPAAVQTYDDHRMAMSFAVAGLKIPGVVIKNSGCVQKTFPRFFEELERLTS